MRESGWFAGSPAIEKKTNSFAVRGVPRVSIDAKGCAVSVRGWDKQEVQYVLTKFSRNPNQSSLDTRVDHTDTQVNIKVSGGGNSARGTYLPGNDAVFNNLSRVKIEVFVPKKSNLRIHTDGEIRLENVSGDIDLQGADEAVNVRDVDGKLRVGTVDGRIRLIGFRGDFNGKTQDGMMNLEGEFEKFDALTVDGTIVLTVPENTSAVFKTNTEIESDGLNLVHDEDANLWRIGKGGGSPYRINVTDGKVIVRCASLMRTN
jgi:DUF4097 and DUF4098 domain-containing protein YvlB